MIPGSGRSPGEGLGHSLQDSWAPPVAQTGKKTPAMRETWVQPLGWEDPLGEGMAPALKGSQELHENLRAFGASQVALVVKNPPAYAGDVRDVGSIPELGRCPGGEHGNPLQCSCLENHRGQRSLVDYSPWGSKESDTTEVT